MKQPKQRSTMNQRMSMVLSLLYLGFAGVIIMLTWWQIVVAGELRARDSNNQTAYYEQRVARGFIQTRDGVRIAGRTARAGASNDKIWSRRYPQQTLAAHLLGYDTKGHSRAGVERALNDYLTGSTRDLGAVIGLLDGDEAAIGDDVTLTINAKVQRVAEQALASGGHIGAIVALEPRTGRITASASSPTFAPATAISSFESIQERKNAPLLNRAMQATYPPGSTFKMVTAAAALRNGVKPSRSFPSGCYEPKGGGGKITNYGGSCSGASSLTYALTHSTNTAFARLGDELGQTALRQQMSDFGFFSKPTINGLPSSEIRASGLSRADGTALPEDELFDTARTAIGQDKLTVTPLQMAMVTAAIANDGVLMQPNLVEQIRRPEQGRIEQRFTAKQIGRAMEVSDARTLATMMENVVNEGSGNLARMASAQVAGKTGTADYAGKNLVWFVAYAPSNAPKIAVAVAIENQPTGSTGGGLAAPIARQVIEAAISGSTQQ